MNITRLSRLASVTICLLTSSVLLWSLPQTSKADFNLSDILAKIEASAPPKCVGDGPHVKNAFTACQNLRLTLEQYDKKDCAASFFECDDENGKNCKQCANGATKSDYPAGVQCQSGTQACTYTKK